MDWARLHAALNDLPAALLLAGVLFDLLGAINKRESLRAAGFWCLIGGVSGGALAALAGVAAEGGVHSESGHSLMETHETMAYVVLVLFAVLAAWRIIRRLPGKQEQTVFTTAGVLGVALMVFTAKLGGDLVFNHAAGIDSHVLQHQLEERQGGAHRHDVDSTGMMVDSAKAPADTAGHQH